MAKIIVDEKTGIALDRKGAHTPLTPREQDLMERETIINFNELEDEATIYTHNNQLRKRLELLATCESEACKAYHDYQFNGSGFTIPKEWIRIIPPAELTEKQMIARRQSADMMRKKHKS